MPDLVENPEGRLSRVAAHMVERRQRNGNINFQLYMFINFQIYAPGIFVNQKIKKNYGHSKKIGYAVNHSTWQSCMGVTHIW